MKARGKAAMIYGLGISLGLSWLVIAIVGPFYLWLGRDSPWWALLASFFSVFLIAASWKYDDQEPPTDNKEIP